VSGKNSLVAAPAFVPRLLNVKQAAQYLGTTVSCMRTLVWNERIKSVRLGQRLLFDRQDLDKFVDDQKDAA
jgi:excisionase family DNA binding protein